MDAIEPLLTAFSVSAALGASAPMSLTPPPYWWPEPDKPQRLSDTLKKLCADPGLVSSYGSGWSPGA
jgi:hypothetical protein